MATRDQGKVTQGNMYRICFTFEVHLTWFGQEHRFSGALNKKTFCIIGPTDATLPRFKSMTKIISDIYDKSREVGLKRCGDNFVQNDSEVKTISVSKVFDTIVKNL